MEIWEYIRMKTTLVLDNTIRQEAKIKALQENRTLSDVVNSLLKNYIAGKMTLKNEKEHYLDDIKTTNLGLKKEKVDRDFIYELS